MNDKFKGSISDNQELVGVSFDNLTLDGRKEDIISNIRNDEILLKVLYSGICGSDLHAYLGENKFTKFPTTLETIAS